MVEAFIKRVSPLYSKAIGSAPGRGDLEEFNVKTLYDKLEDQTLHLASQLARHRKDTQEFYRNICQQTDTLKNVYENMDAKKLSLLKELIAHNALRGKPYDSVAGERDTQAEASLALLSSVLRSVEALLCRVTGEAWQNHDLPAPQHSLPDARECELQAGDSHMCYTQFSSMNMTKPGAATNESAPYLSDHDLSKLVGISPLFRTLQEILQSLQNLTTAESGQNLHNVTESTDHDVQLIPTALDNLSPQHSAVFLFGCQVMQLLGTCPPFPSVLLLLAKSIPASSSSSGGGLLAHCSRDFYFDVTNQILYVSEAKLQHVGQFVAVILQAMACIASGSKPQSFMRALHEAISALSLHLFNVSFKRNTAKSKLNAPEGQHSELAEHFLNIRVPTEPQFAEYLLASRLEKYKYFGLEQLICDLKQSPANLTEKGPPPKGTPIQTSCIEEEIDHMNESFLQLSMQLQNRVQTSTRQTERENSNSDHSARAAPGLSRNGTTLLELKRRYISQRLNELQVTLGQIRRCQQRDSSLGGRTQTGGSATQQERKEINPDVGVRSPSDSQDGFPANPSQGPESDTSAWEGGGRALTPNPAISKDSHMLEKLVDVPGKQEFNDRIAIGNTTGHTDVDGM
ncbi:uncharacterized protein LOC142995324 [Genypterus blacodes]|uniref:uncharacterized protein LOC142995324 n=1 Tax=Genypterus blacodes TaxID=154954 RepID=UPI003F75C928